ncbi:hypothetical protein D3P04_10670 [Paracoccus onubensis]|uniref:Uncharacterized protein n=1 Tax=Paracoccus onubensis TaxID=1675788 RepID=A0A418SWW4_9RHOB|nr:hypothetical protein D3P04_10670 [Paracoccus onubensis]
MRDYTPLVNPLSLEDRATQIRHLATAALRAQAGAYPVVDFESVMVSVCEIIARMALELEEDLEDYRPRSVSE